MTYRLFPGSLFRILCFTTFATICLDSARADYIYTLITDTTTNQNVNAGSINNSGQVAFWTQNSSGFHTINRWDPGSGTITNIMTASAQPNASNGTEAFGRRPGINNLGHVAFRQSQDPSPGSPTQRIRIFENGSFRDYQVSSSSTVFIDPLLSDTGRVAYTIGNSIEFRGGGGPGGSFGSSNLLGLTQSGRIAYSTSGVVRMQTAAGNFEELTLGSERLSLTGGFSETGKVVFRASDNTLANDGVNIYTGVANGSPNMIASADEFTSLSSTLVSMNNLDDVLFVSRKNNVIGLYSTAFGLDNPILEQGDAFDGSTIASMAIGNDSINDSRDIVVRVILADGRDGLYMGQFNAVPEPNATLLLLASAIGLLANRRRN